MDSFEFKIPFSMCIISRRNCGKTHMMQYLADNLLQNKLIDLCILFSETAHLSGDFSEILDKKQILNNFNETSINKIIKYQEKVKSKGKQCLIIIDDSISCVDKHFQSLINKLFSKGRHWNISIVLINQYICGGERGIRTLETVSHLHTFQACAFNHSATSPFFINTL